MASISGIIKKRLMMILVLDLVIGLALPGTIFLISYHIPGSSSIQGLPVGQSVFREFVNNSPDSAQFSSIWTINSTRPFILLRSSPQIESTELIDSNTAISIAMNRLNVLDHGVWQLIEIEELQTPPAWQLNLETSDGNYSSNIRINAISGAIYSYRVQYERELEGSVLPEYMSEQQAEIIAADFLRRFNYMLPQAARYEGVCLASYSYYQGHEVNLTYTMSFQEYFSDVEISSSRIRIDVSTYQRAVCSFSYNWLGVSTIPQFGILTKDDAFHKAISEIADSTDPRFYYVNPDHFSIENSRLVLTRLPDTMNYSSSDSTAYQFCWYGVLTSPLIEVFCDAFSGNVAFIVDSLGLQQFGMNTQSYAILDIILTDVILGMATLVGILGYLFAKWQLGRRQHYHSVSIY